MIDRVDAQGLDVVHVVGRHFGGQLRHGHAPGVRFVDQLVVHVGDVYDQRDFVARVDQVSLDGIEDHRSDHVSDVAGLIDRRPAKINSHLAGRDWFEWFFGFAECVVDAEHGRVE